MRTRGLAGNEQKGLRAARRVEATEGESRPGPSRLENAPFLHVQHVALCRYMLAYGLGGASYVTVPSNGSRATTPASPTWSLSKARGKEGETGLGSRPSLRLDRFCHCPLWNRPPPPAVGSGRQRPRHPPAVSSGQQAEFSTTGCGITHDLGSSKGGRAGGVVLEM